MGKVNLTKISDSVRTSKKKKLYCVNKIDLTVTKSYSLEEFLFRNIENDNSKYYS